MDTESTSTRVEGAAKEDESRHRRTEISATIDPAAEVRETPIPTGERAKSESARSENSETIDHGDEADSIAAQADSSGERVESRAKPSTVSAAGERESGNRENSLWQQVLLALERLQTQIAERDAARSRENAERDAARTREISELRADFHKLLAQIAERDAKNAERDAARTREIAELRADFDKLLTKIADRDALIAERDAKNAERDAARTREISELRADFDKLLTKIAARDAKDAERDAVRTRENAELRADFDKLRVQNANWQAESARRDEARARAEAERHAAMAKFQADQRADFERARAEDAERYRDLTKTMMYTGMGIVGVIVAAIGVAATVLANWGMQGTTHPPSVSAPPAQSLRLYPNPQTGPDASEKEGAQPSDRP